MLFTHNAFDHFFFFSTSAERMPRFFSFWLFSLSLSLLWQNMLSLILLWNTSIIIYHSALALCSRRAYVRFWWYNLLGFFFTHQNRFHIASDCLTSFLRKPFFSLYFSYKNGIFEQTAWSLKLLLSQIEIRFIVSIQTKMVLWELQQTIFNWHCFYLVNILIRFC